MYKRSRSYGGYSSGPYTTRPYRGVYKRYTPNAYRVSRRYTRRGVTPTGVRRIIGMMAEKKFHDIVQTNFSPGDFYTSGWGNATAISQGTTDSERVGDKLLLNSIQYSISIVPQTTTGGANDFQEFRLIVFKWYDDSTPSISDILQLDTPPEYRPNTMLNHDKKVKRKILVDRTICAMASNSAGLTVQTAENYPVMFKGFIDLKKSGMRVRQIAFESGTTTGVGHIYYGIMGAKWNSLAVAPTYVNCDGYCTTFFRTNFIDV